MGFCFFLLSVLSFYFYLICFVVVFAREMWTFLFLLKETFSFFFLIFIIWVLLLFAFRVVCYIFFYFIWVLLFVFLLKKKVMNGLIPFIFFFTCVTEKGMLNFIEKADIWPFCYPLRRLIGIPFCTFFVATQFCMEVGNFP